ncbi:hypothetical protein cand_000010 [Cryptosporidium andersoni]|uniref:Uncharacterized protein n=1 Tax=Cryptosporidium andersoni TaxID=117008 RepID=A0A1J4MQS4_9CRYT|nr:hypothetical protein cand_000010 [Cryptosporidium andersoni]
MKIVELQKHDNATSNIEQLLCLLLFYYIEKEQPMFGKVAIKSGFLDLLLDCYQISEHNLLLTKFLIRVVVRLVRLSPIVAAISWIKLKVNIDNQLLHKDTSLRLWSIRYIASLVKILESNQEHQNLLKFIKPIDFIAKLYILSFDQCLLIKYSSIKLLCYFVISNSNKKMYRSLVYMGIIGVFLDILKNSQLSASVDAAIFPILLALLKLIKSSSRFSLIFIHSDGIKVILNLLNCPVEKIAISILLIINYISNYSAYHANKVVMLENNTFVKLVDMKYKIKSKYTENFMYKTVYNLFIKCTELDVLQDFFYSCRDPDITGRTELSTHLSRVKLTEATLRRSCDRFGVPALGTM